MERYKYEKRLRILDTLRMMKNKVMELENRVLVGDIMDVINENEINNALDAIQGQVNNVF